MFVNFPNTLKVKVIETGELVSGGSVKVAKSLDLAHMQLVVYVHGSLAGTEALRCRLFSDQAMVTPALATSSYAYLSAIPNMGTYWIGRLRFDFSGEPLNAAATYWVGVDATGYARNANTAYLGLVLDYSLNQVNQPAALWMALYGQRWLG